MILTVDPGIEGTGWALWDEATWTQCVPPLAQGAVFPGHRKGEGTDFVSKSDRVIDKLWAVLWEHRRYHVTKCYCEFPKLMESNYAATRGDNTFKLAYFVGRIGECCRRQGTLFIPVDVNDWKGNLPKTAVDARIMRRLGETYDNHISDAVGIGLWAKGVWSGGGVARHSKHSDSRGQ